MRRRRKKLNDQHALHDLFLQDDIKAETRRLVAQRREEHGNPIEEMMGALERLKAGQSAAIERQE